ncbi:MAG: AAA domain-containing protein [Chloroflexi bacterium]|nr:AAA domain-containing protein [Chloroflexota bacterium]
MMNLEVRLFVQRQENGNYTVTVPLFRDVSAYDPSLETCKKEIGEVLVERLQQMEPAYLQNFQFDPEQTLEQITVQICAHDRKEKRRRQAIALTVSVMLSPKKEGEILVTVPRLQFPLSFYIRELAELLETAQLELAHYFYGDELEEIVPYQTAQVEVLDVIEVEFTAKRPSAKDENSSEDGDYDGNGSSILQSSGVNLTQEAKAEDGQLGHAYHRETEVEQVLAIVSAPRHASVLLVGSSGVGKTAIVHEVVRRITNKACAETLYDREVWAITGDRLIAGAVYIGQWQGRAKNLVQISEKNKYILFIDDIATLTELGRWSKGDDNIADFLKPHIQRGDVVIIGETTAERLRQANKLSPGFVAQFRTIQIDPTNEGETSNVLATLARSLERSQGIRIESSAIDATVMLTDRFFPYRALPGKAVALLEQLALEMGRKSKKTARATKPLLERRHVVEGFSRQTGLPALMLSDSEALDLGHVDSYFSERVIGQDEAITSMVDLIAMIKSGLTDPEKPLGVFLFIGPTGVGKTQLAKTLAAYLFGDENRLLRFDMSEFNDPVAVRRLLGAPGSEEEGELTRQVRAQPFCVLLLDEFEKADHQIYDIFLQVMGEGRLTDASGRTTSFRNAIILLTSNLGASAREQRGLGLGATSSPQATGGEALPTYWQRKIEQYFRPEFINRIDHIVAFKLLDEQAMRLIARRELGNVLLREGLIRRNVLVDIDECVIDLLLEQGFNPTYGARPLKRAVEHLIVLPLARYLASRAQPSEDVLRLICRHGKIALSASRYVEQQWSSVIELDAGLVRDDEKWRRLDDRSFAQAFAELQQQLQAWMEHGSVVAMQNERSKNLEETHKPSFWDDGEAARATLARFYFIDRLLNRLHQLADRAEFLEELAGLVHRQRDPQYRQELIESYEKLYRDVAYLDAELLFAHLEENHEAALHLKRVATSSGRVQKGSWLLDLTAIYVRWARRKGYEIEVFVLKSYASQKATKPSGASSRADRASASSGGSKWRSLPSEDVSKLLKQVLALPEDTPELVIDLKGTNVYGFLQGENGVHRRDYDRSSGKRTKSLVEVKVMAPDDTVSAMGLERELAGHEQDTASEQGTSGRQIVRTYQFEGDQVVKDHRTGTKVYHIASVQDGHLDEFILANLRQSGDLKQEDTLPE